MNLEIEYLLKVMEYYLLLKTSENIDEIKSKNLNGKDSQKLLDHIKQYATDALKTASKKSNSKTERSKG